MLFYAGLQCNAQETTSTVSQFPVNLRTICRLPNILTESSGIAIEGSNRIWSHEDSGNANQIYCFDTTGALLRTLTISNASNIDWEDMAVDNNGTWFIGDFGNNDNNRTNLAIYTIPNPETIPENTVNAGIIHFSLQDQTAFPPPASNRNFDIEAMAWHSDSLFLFTKDRSNPFTGITKMYALPDIPGTYTARMVDSYFVGNTIESGRVTSADINHNSGELVLLTNSKLVSFTNYPGNRFFNGAVNDFIFTTTPGQNEGIAFKSGNRLLMTEEGNGSTPGFLYEIIIGEDINVSPEPTNFPDSFSAHNIHLEWLDATGDVLPDGYLVRMSPLDFESVATPMNGTIYPDSDFDKNVATGNQNVWFTGLNANTGYYFKIFSFKDYTAYRVYKAGSNEPQIQKSTTP
jgi:hypothetical protein